MADQKYLLDVDQMIQSLMANIERSGYLKKTVLKILYGLDPDWRKFGAQIINCPSIL